MRDMAHKRPRVPLIRRRIKINLRLTQILRYTIPRQQYRTRTKVPNRLGQLIQKRLIPQPPAINLVVDARALGPSFTQVEGLIDGEVRVGVVVPEVVFPGCEEDVGGFAVLV